MGIETSARTAEERLPRRWGVLGRIWVVWLVGLGLSVAGAEWMRREADRLDQERFEAATRMLAGVFTAYMERVEGFLLDAARELSREPTMWRPVWEEFMDLSRPQWTFVGLVGIGYAENRGMGEAVEAVEPWIRSEDRRPREWIFNSMGRRRDAGLFRTDPSEWTLKVMEFFQPDLESGIGCTNIHEVRGSADNSWIRRRLEGFDPVPVMRETPTFLTSERGGLEFFNDLEATRAADAVCREEVTVMTGPWLGLRNVGPSRVLMIAPVAHPLRRRVWSVIQPAAHPQRSEAEWLRWRFNAGLVLGVIDLGLILRDMQGLEPSEISVGIHGWNGHTATPVSEETMLVRTSGGEGAVGDRGSRVLSATHRLPMYGVPWQMTMRATPKFYSRSTRYRMWVVLAVGGTMTACGAWVMWMQLRRQREQEQQGVQLEAARDAVQAVLMERERLAHDLHDGTIQMLYALELRHSVLAGQLRDRDPDGARVVDEIRETLGQIAAHTRKFLLREPGRDDGPAASPAFSGAMAAIVERYRRTGISKIQLDCDLSTASVITSDQGVELAAILSEALSNCVRHSGATEIRVELSMTGARVRMRVADNGEGFDVSGETGAGLGIPSMRSRADRLGGELSLVSTAAGSVVEVQFEREGSSEL